MARLRFTLTIGAALAAAACNGTQPPPAPPAADRSVQAPAPPRQDLPEEQRSPDLYGAWIVQSVATRDGALRERFWDMTLFVGARQLEVLSQCVTIGPFDYGRTVGGGIRISQTPVTPRPGTAGAPPVAQCARGLSPAEAALGPLLLAAADVRLEGDGTVSLTGKAGAVTLRRPAGALSNPFGQSPPPRLPPPVGAWRFVSIDGRAVPPGQNMELLLRPRHIEWRSGCVNEVRRLTHDRDSLTPGESDPFPVCERGRSEAEVAAGRLLEGPISFRISDDGRMRLQGSGVTAELEPLTR